MENEENAKSGERRNEILLLTQTGGFFRGEGTEGLSRKR